jgi:CheY-like chemotaxis protein
VCAHCHNEAARNLSATTFLVGTQSADARWRMMNKSQPTILLVDDSEDDILLFRRALQSNGFAGKMVTFDTATGASLYLKQEGPHQDAERPDLIVSDSVVDHESGLDLLEWVRVHPRFKEIPFVMLTGSADPGVIQRALQLGATSVFKKPVTFDQLVGTASEILQSAKPSSKN